MFYQGSTFELYVELIEPEMLKDSYIIDPLVDGIRYYIMKEDDYGIVQEGLLGNNDRNSYLSYNYQIDSPEKEGVYLVCLLPSDTIF